jgi:aminopeptidase N
MKHRLVATAVILALTGWAGVRGQAPAPAAAPVATARHALTVSIEPATHTLTATDTVSWPGPPEPARLTFLLNAHLRITASEPAAVEVPVAPAVKALGIGADAAVPLKAYRVLLPGGAPTFRVSYQGPIDVPLTDPKEEYTRGFRETSGLIGPQGVYLAGSTFWHPQFGPELVTFTIDAAVPESWHLISQGNGTSRGANGRASWTSGLPMDEIYLVGGPLQAFADAAGSVETLVYLHERDTSTAGKYLAATAQYLEMYRSLIGPYPYGKFALVENFWETGYGMPTFTLLGPQIIRFPFIINSSYPHEILHNWWGNSVFVDYATGNWCEGLTAYMADHLIAEQRGTGDEYRRSTLQKYRDYVKTGRDFPLAQFRGRSSAATEAVGYGKALMGFHMLRRAMGDDAFRKTVASFYKTFNGRRATFRDFQRTAETVAGKPYGWIFDDLIGRVGAPALSVSAGPAGVRQEGSAFVVSGTLRQTQPGAPFSTDVPVTVHTERGGVTTVVRMTAAQQAFSIGTDARPVELFVDPRFDVFRRLDPRETPPSIGQIFGEPAILAVLPSAEGAAALDGYRALLKGWQSDAHHIAVRLDTEVTALPADRSVWIVGRLNRHLPKLLAGTSGVKVSGERVELDGETLDVAGRTFVATFRHPGNVEKAVGWIAAEPVAALPGLGRKLPHYGKYSYLAFEGAEPVNTVKGQWANADSPLHVDLRPVAQRSGRLPALPPEARRALAELPPVFSQQALREHVQYLASPELKGRGLGSAGLAAAVRYVADRFTAYGLTPGGDAGSFLQSFQVAKGEDGQPHQVANVIGVLPGSNPAFKDQSAIVCAHLDHLGLGWPDVHKGDEGKVHPGADDNASGVAVLLELARASAAGEKPPRTILFIAVTGEEAGRLGSKYYVDHPVRPLAGVEGVINLDTVGRLGTGRVSALGTGSAAEWPHIFRGASFVTGVESRNVAESVEASDQVSFTEKGVPAVQIFTAATADYHRPSDTPDKIDVAGLVKVATWVREGLVYLAERPDPLTNQLKPATVPAHPAGAPTAGTQAGAAPARRASFGTVPDFAFEGPGVRVTGVVADSPASNAGVKEGDVLLRINDKDIGTLQEYSTILRTLAPGQTITVVVRRGSQALTLTATLAER